MPDLRYGAGSSVHLEFAHGAELDHYGMPQGSPLDDPAAAVSAALDAPLDFPTLRQSTTPGDRVVLALGHALPRAAEVVASVIRSLLSAGVDPDGISVLRTEADVDVGSENPCRLLQDGLGERIRLLTHDPANRRSLAYLAASDAGEPILLNRLLTDADLVLPIGCLQADDATGYFGIHTSIFPSLSDHRTQSRFRRLDGLRENGRPHRALTDEVNHVAWLLGINFTIQLVPAAGDGVMHVLAGQSEAVRRIGRQLYRTTWACPVPRPASLVVAAIEGGAQQQTWENLGRALEAAVRLGEEGGAIVVCCDLAAEPGPAIQRLAGARCRHTAMQQILRDAPGDALPAAQLARALDRDRVYLLSRLDPALVEELDMVPLGSPDELARLVRYHTSCALLANAPHAIVPLRSE